LDVAEALKVLERVNMGNIQTGTTERPMLKRKKVFNFSTNKKIPLPKKAWANREQTYVSKNTLQGRMTAKILTLKVGEMFTMTFTADPSEVSSRLTTFRKRFPDVKITTRRLGENEIGIWRI
jgi:hypothetical protein